MNHSSYTHFSLTPRTQEKRERNKMVHTFIRALLAGADMLGISSLILKIKMGNCTYYIITKQKIFFQDTIQHCIPKSKWFQSVLPLPMGAAMLEWKWSWWPSFWFQHGNSMNSLRPKNNNFCCNFWVICVKWRQIY